MPRDYMAWKKEFALRIPYTARKALAAPCSVFCTFTYATPKKKPENPPVGDVDNLAKGVMDALKDGGVLADDRWVVQLVARKGYGPADSISVRIEPCGC